MKTCQKCGCDLTGNRKYCVECKKALKREYAKQHYKKNLEKGIVKLRYGKGICPYCGEEFIKATPNQITHKKCYLEHIHKTVPSYNQVRRDKKGNTIGRSTILNLGFILTNKMVVHHIDENPKNNNLTNLMILGRKNHARLHRLLEKKWSLLSKGDSSNLENCWNILRDQLTTAWLETMSANVIKITDIGQSAAEPLNEDNIYIFTEEGSETMYQVPKQ